MLASLGGIPGRGSEVGCQLLHRPFGLHRVLSRQPTERLQHLGRQVEGRVDPDMARMMLDIPLAAVAGFSGIGTAGMQAIIDEANAAGGA